MNLDKFENNILKKSESKEISVYETGIIDLPKGSIIEIRGLSNSGINHLALQLVKAIQDNDGVGLYIDADHTLDTGLLGNINPVLMQPNSPEEIFNILSQKDFLKYLNITVIDSVLNLLPLDMDYTAFNKNLCKLVKNVKNTDCTIIVLNPYMSNKYSILSQCADIIISLKRVKTLKNHSGLIVNGTILKNLINLTKTEFSYKVIY